MNDPFSNRRRDDSPQGAGFQASMTTSLRPRSEADANALSVVVLAGAAARCERLGVSWRDGLITKEQFFEQLGQLVRVLQIQFPQQFGDRLVVDGLSGETP